MVDYMLLIVAAATVTVAAVIYLYTKSRSAAVPGLQPTNSEDGNLGDVKNAGSLHEFLREMHASYGPITSFYWGQQLTVSIASPELFKEHSKVFDRPVELFKMFEPLITKHSIQYANGADGRERRKLYDTAFTHTAILKYYTILEKTTEELAEQLSAIPKDKVIPLMDYMVTFAIKSISMVGFGDFFDDDNCKKLMQGYNLIWKEMESRLGGDTPDPGEPRYELLERERNKIFELVRGAIKHRKEQPSGTEDMQLIDAILESGKPEAVQLADAISYIVAGFHSTATVLAWSFYYLCTHPDVEARLLKELEEILKGGCVSPSNKQDLVYLKQVCDETLRCSQGPFAARTSDTGSYLGGYFIPAKTPVIQALGVLHHDERYWPDPYKFDPDRFKTKPANFTFEPFGFAGKRRCPSYHFSYLEIMMVISILLPKFKFQLQCGHAVVPVYGLVTKPSEPIWVTVHERE